MNDGSALTLPGFPRDVEGPVFKEPWEARAFAMALRLHEGGLFTWSEWADALSQEIRAARVSHDTDLGDAYYQHWLRALEALVSRKGAASTGELDSYSRAWASAARRTPHGSPIELAPQDLEPVTLKDR
ncbi:MAG: nitrile hydratase accessory protein [Gammaproteobacteria bacterium]